ncbi:MAG: 30S ribosomal protein S5, partial [Dehalococcoidia bacterium]|nr:30S ribosomal protein S5 [Dehalococcoidia bacterium]
VRTVLQLAGIKNVISKSLGSQNRINVARATILALTSLRSVDRRSSKSGVEAVLPEVYDATE